MKPNNQNQDRSLLFPEFFAAVFILSFQIAAVARGATYSISTSAAPSNGWRAIAPVGNLEGLPIGAVGLDWEAAHVGWNSSLAFDDSDAQGWHQPVTRDVTIYGGDSTNNIWASGEQGVGETPAYFRKTFTLDNQPAKAFFGSSLPLDWSNIIDDDVQIYINGTLVWDDQNNAADVIPL